MSETTDLIKHLRGRGLSQSEISRLSGIPQPRLSRWESGEVPASADDALKLAALVAGGLADSVVLLADAKASCPQAVGEARQ